MCRVLGAQRGSHVEFASCNAVPFRLGNSRHRVPALLAALDLEIWRCPGARQGPDANVAAVGVGEVPLTVLDARVRTVLSIATVRIWLLGVPVGTYFCGHSRAGEPPAGATQATALAAERRDRSTDVIR